MHRRELLRLLSGSAIVPVISPELFAILQQRQPTGNYSFRSLNVHQNDTVIAMAETIIPSTDTPGAKSARVNEFIDVILTDWATPEERKKFLAGIADVDIQSGVLFGRTFVEAAPQQQLALLEAMDDAIDWAHEPRVMGPAAADPYDRHLQGEFFRVFKTVTIHGYYTSEIGFTKELKLEIIPGAQHGCVPVLEEKKS